MEQLATMGNSSRHMELDRPRVRRPICIDPPPTDDDSSSSDMATTFYVSP